MGCLRCVAAQDHHADHPILIHLQQQIALVARSSTKRACAHASWEHVQLFAASYTVCLCAFFVINQGAAEVLAVSESNRALSQRC